MLKRPCQCFLVRVQRFRFGGEVGRQPESALGFLSIAAIRKLARKPDIILIDGQGIAHPRGFGIACHIGVLLDIPTIGCAKTRLVGDYREPGIRKGWWSDLNYEGSIVGAVLRTRHGARPLFISPGHRIDRSGAVSFVLSCVRKYRIPEPLRCADAASRDAAKKATGPDL